ncbi:hypothetical protein EYF80_037501 [Liparis tanakae]|uniref:Uncharacterized protein n=1 Tax=Liparis tanakae TaxID=230148 RepID=A0A4Z2GHN2_9TELE|nr:hypothetical protein EYF80_037501 [Liparis tanakae]
MAFDLSCKMPGIFCTQHRKVEEHQPEGRGHMQGARGSPMEKGESRRSESGLSVHFGRKEHKRECNKDSREEEEEKKKSSPPTRS